MKWKNRAGLAAVLWLLVSHARGQGSLVVDQASGTLEEPVVNAYRTPENQLAQSFTPSLNAVGFVQLRSLLTAPSGSSVTVMVNLRQGAYDGPIISSTDPLVIIGFAGVGTFYFPGNIPVTAGQMYFFEPVLKSAGSVDVGFKSPSPYLSGELFINGTPSTAMTDLWFREGIVVPEPSTFSLLGLGAGLAFMLRKSSLSSSPGAIRPARTRTSNASPRMAARPATGAR